MKILMYSDVFGGPTTTFIFNDLNGLSQNHTLKYLCTSVVNGSMTYNDVVKVDYKVNLFVRKTRWILEKNGLYLEFFSSVFSKKINDIIDEFQPNIIQCNFGYEALRLIDNLNEKNKKIPIVINFLGYDASFHLNRASYVRKLIGISKLKNIYATCNTSFLKNNLESKGIYFRENRVIHTGVKLDYFDRMENYPVNEKEYIFLQIATLAERKGQEITLKAFKQVLETFKGNKKIKLIFAGGNEDSYGNYIRTIPKELGIQNQVEFCGWVSPGKARELMLRANCFIHHSRTVKGRTEGIPTALSEAMAMELPVISTWHAGISELVEDGVNGFLVKENDIINYSERMKNILSWSYLKINREKVKKQFNIVSRINAFEEYYKDILSCDKFPN